jgi:predicted DCC family thiol-disulfide oxidoreductase YuxK
VEPRASALVAPVRYPLTVFYDASCPLCATEMHALRELDPEGRIELVDCSASDFDESVLAGMPITRADLMQRIHARDARGRWRVGLDAFEAVYRAAGLERAARLWGNGRWRPLFDRLYPWIARNRQLLSRLGLHRIVGRLIRR